MSTLLNKDTLTINNGGLRLLTKDGLSTIKFCKTVEEAIRLFLSFSIYVLTQEYNLAKTC